MMQVTDVPEQLFVDARAMRRDLHRHPELGFKERRTASLIAAQLRALSIEVYEGIATTGVVGVVRGAKPGRTIMLRADMDALPLPEEKDVPYRSTVAGVMHACGHDGHVATLLAAARLVAERKDEVRGTVVFCFQPAEEGLGGARVMVEEGVLERFGVERAYGLHYVALLPTGVVATRPGPIMASADSFDVEITGRGGHGSDPARAIDPIAAAAQSIVALNQIVGRRIDALSPAVVNVCAVNSGTTYNVIPSSAHLKGTIRSLDETVRATLIDQVRDVCKHASATMGATSDVSFAAGGFPVTVNDDDQVAYVRSLAASVCGADRWVDMAQPVMGSEDFSYFAQRVPACFLFVGSNGGEATAYMNHHGKFDLDERAMQTGIALLHALASDAPENAP